VDWQIIVANLVAGITTLVILLRLVQRDRRDQKMVQRMNGLAADLASCNPKPEIKPPEEGIQNG
jgi:uncharacterized membrane-anchored protein YhcB (DUF1043 family)